jgi:hypothetical protein
VSNYTRVLSRLEEFPSFDEMADLIRDEHPACRLALEEGDEDEWEILLLSGEDNLEIALVERYSVYPGSLGQDEIADFLEDLRDCKPESGVAWLRDYLETVKTIYTFQPLHGADTEEGSSALHGLRSALWERGESIIQADNEGFTNEEGFHIVWQFSDSVSGPWNMGVFRDGIWHQFKMDLGDPDHRAAFQRGEVPADIFAIQLSGSRD